ncbi:ssDNA-binding protein [Corynebacterium freneyi]|uniref:ssDNA-binding protein n=1 Tax=Corynebacterium freneyi TaxID=134034 RepID=UPI0032B7DB04
MSTQNPTRVVTGEVRLSYAHIFEPNSIQGGKPKCSVSLIIPRRRTPPPSPRSRRPSTPRSRPVRPSSVGSAQTRPP